MEKHIHKFKYYIKMAAAFLLYYSGIIFIVKYIKLRNKAVVLTYHRILPYSVRKHSFSHEAIMVDPASFERQINFLRKHFKILETRDFISHFEHQSKFDNSSCLITFDDGWKDNYDYAFPILKKYNVPALIFPAVDYIGSGKLFWQEEMGHGFYQILNQDKPTSHILDQHSIHNLKDKTEEEQLAGIRNHVRTLKSLSYDQIQEIMENLSDFGNIDHGKVDVYMNWEQIREMDVSIFSFGSHACSHRILTRLDDDEINDELSRSRHCIEQALGHSISAIAYPNGNYDDRLGKITRNQGYQVGFGTEFGSVSTSDYPLNLKRININDTISRNNPIMLATILGIF